MAAAGRLNPAGSPTPSNQPSYVLRTVCRGDDGEPFAAGAAGLTQHFIVLGLPDGTLAFFGAADQALASEFQHTGGAITALYPNADGTL